MLKIMLKKFHVAVRGIGQPTALKHRSKHIIIAAFLLTQWAGTAYRIKSATLGHNSILGAVYSSRSSIFNTKSRNLSIQTHIKQTEGATHSLKQYIVWHNHMHTYVKRNKNLPDSPSILLWRCPDGNNIRCAGVGDRFRAIQFSMLLAIATKRLLLIEWPDNPFSFKSVMMPSVIDWSPVVSLDVDNWPILEEEEWPKMQWNREPQLSIGNGSRDKTFGTNLEAEKVLDIVNFRDHLIFSYRASENSTFLFSKNKYVFDDLLDLQGGYICETVLHRTLLKVLFRPTELVTTAMRKLIGDKVIKNGYVAVHVRTGDGLGESAGYRFAGKFSNHTQIAVNMAQCIDMFSQIPVRKRKTLFLASDSAKLKHSFRRELIKKGTKVISSNVSVLHAATKYRPSSSTAFSFKTWTSFVNIFVDLFALAGSELIVSNRSGFSRIAYFFGSAKALIATDPHDKSYQCEHQSD